MFNKIFPQHVRDKAFGISLLGQTICLIALTQPRPRFNEQVGAKSYWLIFALNVTALLSVIVILPGTKGISLERMDKIFGQLDAVEAGEREAGKGIEQEEDMARGRAASTGGDPEKDGRTSMVEDRRQS